MTEYALALISEYITIAAAVPLHPNDQRSPESCTAPDSPSSVVFLPLAIDRPAQKPCGTGPSEISQSRLVSRKFCESKITQG